MTFNKCVFNVVIQTFHSVLFKIIYFYYYLFRNLLKDFQSARLKDLIAFRLTRSRLRVYDLLELSYQGFSFGLIMTSLFGTHRKALV